MIPRPEKTEKKPLQRLLNKSFYKFLSSFIAVVVGTLLLILVLGIGSNVQ